MSAAILVLVMSTARGADHISANCSGYDNCERSFTGGVLMTTRQP
jgi:hypothetical protein